MNLNHLGIAGIYHLVFFGLLLPWSAVKSARRLKTHSYPPRRKYFLTIIAQQCFFVFLSFLVAWMEWVEVWEQPRSLYWYLAGLAVLLTLVAAMLPRWRSAVEKRERRVYLFMARDNRERSLWVLISLLAGIGEELTYRGVMFILLWRITGSPGTAALIAAVVFGFSHYVQGWKSSILIGGFALIFQALYYFSGSLIIPMLVHFLYDVTAGMMYGYFGNKLSYPPEGIPPELSREFTTQGAE